MHLKTGRGESRVSGVDLINVSYVLHVFRQTGLSSHNIPRSDAAGLLRGRLCAPEDWVDGLSKESFTQDAAHIRLWYACHSVNIFSGADSEKFSLGVKFSLSWGIRETVLTLNIHSHYPLPYTSHHITKTRLFKNIEILQPRKENVQIKTFCDFFIFLLKIQIVGTR